MTAALQTWVRTYRAEGLAAVRDRALDRWSESRLRPTLVHAASGSWPVVEILNVIGVEMVSRGGGVPLQLRARLRQESAHRAVALLARGSRGGFDLECWAGGHSRRRSFPGDGRKGDPLREEPAWLEAVRAAARLVGARTIHIESIAGLSLRSLVQLSTLDGALVVSAHDFGAFCRRPNLWDSSGNFCEYSTDDHRCQRCLSASSQPAEIDQRTHRSLSAQLMAAATVLIYPSTFLRDRLSDLIPSTRAISREVIAPGLDYRETETAIRDADQVGFIGSAADHKGGMRLPRLAHALVARGVTVTVYGGNGHHNLLDLRRIPRVRVRGYFRAGTLPSLLIGQRTAAALLLPGIPETFSLALSDAWAAGVPVVAPALGALAERLQHGGGELTSPYPSDEEVLAAIERVRRKPVDTIPSPPTAGSSARGHLELYRRRGFLSV